MPPDRAVLGGCGPLPPCRLVSINFLERQAPLFLEPETGRCFLEVARARPSGPAAQAGEATGISWRVAR